MTEWCESELMLWEGCTVYIFNELKIICLNEVFIVIFHWFTFPLLRILNAFCLEIRRANCCMEATKSQSYLMSDIRVSSPCVLTSDWPRARDGRWSQMAPPATETPSTLTTPPATLRPRLWLRSLEKQQINRAQTSDCGSGTSDRQLLGSHHEWPYQQIAYSQESRIM